MPRTPEEIREYRRRWRANRSAEKKAADNLADAEWRRATGRTQRKEYVPATYGPRLTPEEFAAAVDDPRHGTTYGYKRLKCRCEDCTRANREYTAAYVARKATDS